MKRISIFLVVAMILAVSLPALAKNKVVIQGDMLRDGFLTINLDWQVDTRKYKGIPKGEIRDKVREDMYKELLPELVKKTDGLAVSYDKSNFTKLSENVKLVQDRKDGSEVFDVDVTVRFAAPCQASAVKTKPTKSQEQDQNALLLRSWDNTF